MVIGAGTVPLAQAPLVLPGVIAVIYGGFKFLLGALSYVRTASD